METSQEQDLQIGQTNKGDIDMEADGTPSSNQIDLKTYINFLSEDELYELMQEMEEELTREEEYVEEAIEQMDFDKQQEMELFEQDINEYQMWEMEQEQEGNQQTDVQEDHEMI
eukprot:CAMPEP_0178941760 /NCGR_PEP_ID=MMETSP0789-20121207/1595_1 /TAXON_ID=3005 /ORGANISM="Rhizosolenia setigera, Strain CCMP 1694" /LENGTH=113 /DNA_ID=CAMNT_0020621049 /DNA_START=608 /DNA_END=949 /DNA_ORIENTATION=+